MIQASKIMLSAALCGAMAVSANGAVQVMTAFDTSPAFVASGTANHALVSITDASGTYSDLSFTTTDDANNSNILYGVNGTAPASGNAALSDNLVDTGKLSVGQFTEFDLGVTASASDKLFIIFNAGTTVYYQGPGLVVAQDSLGNGIGSVTVNENSGPNDAVLIGDLITTADLARVGSSTLFLRPIYGVTIDIADFGVADPSQIASFRIAGEVTPNGSLDAFDINVVGLAVPEPASAGLLLAGALCLCARRRG